MGEREKIEYKKVEEYERTELGLDSHDYYIDFLGKKGKEYIENAINADPTLKMRSNWDGTLIAECGENGNRESFALLYDIYRRINIISYAQENVKNQTLRIFLPKEKEIPVFYSVFNRVPSPSYLKKYDYSQGDILGGKTKVRQIAEKAKDYLFIRLIAHQNFGLDEEIKGVPIDRIHFLPFRRKEDLSHSWEMDDSLSEFLNKEKPGPVFVRYKEKIYPALTHEFIEYDRENGNPVPLENRESDAYFSL